MNESETCKPDSTTFSMLIDMYAKQCNPESAADILLEMIDRQAALDRVYFNSIMDAYCKQGNFEKVIEYFQMMESHGLKLGDDTFSILINMYGMQQNIQGIEETLKKMATLQIQPTKFTIGTIIRAFFENDEFVKAKYWYENLKQRGMFPSSPILITMMRISLLEKQPLEQVLFHFEIGERLGVVNLALCHEYAKAMLIHGMDINQVISQFLDKIQQRKLKLNIKSVYLFIDGILRPSSLALHLRNKDIKPTVEQVQIKQGKKEFQQLVDLVKLHGNRIYPKLESEVEQCLKSLL